MMTNSFIRFTSEGGYLGRFCWSNTGSIAGTPWGRTRFLANETSYPQTLVNPSAPEIAWAGHRPMVRYLTQSLPLEYPS